MFTIACCLVVGLELGLDLIASCWLMFTHTYLLLSLRCYCRFPVCSELGLLGLRLFLACNRPGWARPDFSQVLSSWFLEAVTGVTCCSESVIKQFVRVLFSVCNGEIFQLFQGRLALSGTQDW